MWRENRMFLCIFQIILLTVFHDSSTLAQIYPQPEQIHLSIGNNVDEIVVTWVTLSSVNQSLVRYSVDSSLDMTVKGTQSTFVDGGSEKRKIYMHRATLSNLQPQTKYVYSVGSEYGWSTEYSFRTLNPGTKWAPRFAMFGDMGNKNAVSLGKLQTDVEQNQYDMILHVGDLAYDMDTNNAEIGDEFMRQIQPIAANVPYMTCPGNHEIAYNFSNYKARFSMPGGDGQGQFYSFNVGPVHFIYFNSEFYYYAYYGWEQIMNQYLWIKKDLEVANTPSNRALRPWIIAMAHRPMYCSNSNDGNVHCTNKENLVRVGIPIPGSDEHMFGLEQLFYDQGVDMIVAAHEHSYERMWPVYDWTVCKGPKEPYTDPPAPVHIVTGSAGCQEGVDPFIPGGQPWSEFRSSDYGFTRFQVLNQTHLYLEQYSDVKKSIIDKLWIKKSKHGAGIYTCHKSQLKYRYVNKEFVLDWIKLQPSL